VNKFCINTPTGELDVYLDFFQRNKPISEKLIGDRFFIIIHENYQFSIDVNDWNSIKSELRNYKIDLITGINNS